MHARLAGPLLALLAGAGACDQQNRGVPPPDDQLVFPNGLLLDPRPLADGEAARYLWVVNGNNDLSFNAGTVAAIDLARFWSAWFDPARGGVDPWCGPARCVQPEGAATSEDFPCRRIGDLPHVVECDERHFIGETDDGRPAVVRVGDFPTVLAASREAESVRLWVPVRGDPSLTYIDLRGGDPQRIGEIDCGQGTDPDETDARRCAGDHVLTHERNEDELPQLDREPFNLVVSEGGGLRERLLFVSHAGTDTLTLVDLDFAAGGERRPAIVQQAPNFTSQVPGGFGLAAYPCDPAGAPTLTEDCTRPLVFAGYRYERFVTSFTASGIDLGANEQQSCAESFDEIGQLGKIICEAQLRSRSVFPVAVLDPAPTSLRPVLGDLAFFPDDPDVLWVVQTNPGSLVRVDTAVDERGDPGAFPSLPPIEICDEPTRMALWQDGADRFAVVSCFRAAEVFVVDLVAHRTVDTVRVGTGPHDLAVDAVRAAVYVANTLEGSISVIDLSRARPTRFQEMARIGLRDPFER